MDDPRAAQEQTSWQKVTSRNTFIRTEMSNKTERCGVKYQSISILVASHSGALFKELD